MLFMKADNRKHENRYWKWGIAILYVLTLSRSLVARLSPRLIVIYQVEMSRYTVVGWIEYLRFSVVIAWLICSILWAYQRKYNNNRGMVI